MGRAADRGGGSSRGRGKFKVARGGGRHFSRDISVIDDNMERMGLEDDEDEEDESEEEESSEEEEAEQKTSGVRFGAVESQEPEMSRAERKALKKAQAGKKGGQQNDEDSDEDDDAKADDILYARENAGPSRKEREAAEKQAAKERYEKLHAAGKTEQAQKDLARLAEIRKKREADAVRRKAEQEEAARAAEAKKNQRSFPRK